MCILLNPSSPRQMDRWASSLQNSLPNHQIVKFPDIDKAEQINYAVVWQHPFGDLKNYPNLKLIFSLGAGIDHLTADPELPNTPIVRLHDTLMAQDMANYCLYWVLDIQNHYSQYRKFQPQKYWKPLRQKPIQDITIGLLGLGNIGKYIAEYLQQHNYKVIGYSKNAKHIPHIKSYQQKQLNDFLQQCHIIINCLPLTPQTNQFINQELLQKLPSNSHLINISRGPVIHEADLIKVLDSDHLASAVIDVMNEEPPASDHPFWTHSKIHLTPHISGKTNLERATKIIGQNILDFEQNKTVSPLYNRQSGY